MKPSLDEGIFKKSQFDLRNVFSKTLGKIELTLSGTFLIISCTLMFVGVLFRETVGYSSAVFEELVRFSIIWSIFVGASWSLKNDKHIVIDILLRNLPKKVALLLQSFAFVLGFAFCCLIFIKGIDLVVHSYSQGERSMSAWRIPMFIPKLAVPVGALLMSFRFIEKIIQHVNALRRGDFS